MANVENASLKTEDYVVSVSIATGNTKKDTRIILKEFIAQIVGNTKTGLPSQFVGLGKIEINDVKAAEKRNPKTGQKVQVEAHQKPKFKFSGKVRNSLRGLEDTATSAE